MAHDQLSRQIELDPEPRRRAVDVGGAVEALKDVGDIPGRNAGSLIFDPDKSDR